MNHLHREKIEQRIKDDARFHIGEPGRDINGFLIVEPEEPMTGHLSTPETALSFVLAGHAIFTARSERTQVRYTFKVTKVEDKPNQFFVSLLSGPGNNADYSYMGMVRDNVFRLTRASKMREDSAPIKSFRWVLEHLQRGVLPPSCQLCIHK